MSSSIIRAALDALFPPGELWNPEDGESFDQQLDGISDTIEDVKSTIDSLEHIRNPYKTPVFTDLERNFGFLPNDDIDLDIRQKRLATRIYKKDRVNAVQDLQNDLTSAGFNVLVHQNDPPVDPALFYTPPAKILVNTPIRIQLQATTMQAGASVAYAGYNEGGGYFSCAGYFEYYIDRFLQYFLPTDPKYWPMIFFVGGTATRNPSGELTSIAFADVDSNRQVELDETILRAKSLGIWCVLIVNYV